MFLRSHGSSARFAMLICSAQLALFAAPVSARPQLTQVPAGAVGRVTNAQLQAPSAPARRYADPDEIYSALRDQPHTRLSIGGGEIDVVFADDALGLDRARVLDWIRTSAQAVTTYFGRFPVTHVGILVIAADGDRIRAGTTYGFDGSAIRIPVGRAAADAAFKDDWILVHEMTHLALPTVSRRSQWLLEGNATYIEPIARAQAGQLDTEWVWQQSIEGMPKGLPMANDHGLDNTPTWGRTYWGGAIFWLLADVQIRERTHGKLGVQDAMRAINRRSGGNGARWTVDQVMNVGDEATKTDVLSALYAQMKATPVSTDLQNLFGKLGIAERDGKIVFDDQASLAAIRRQITAAPKDSRAEKK
jgi:predicted metalloprotease with PDZ domain